MLGFTKNKVSRKEQQILLNLAKQSIEYGLKNNAKLKIDLQQYPKSLQEPRACFVTLNKHKQLRGCIGALIARSPLVVEVVDSAYAAAFLDHRFSKVTADEFKDLEFHISILTAPQLMQFSSEEDLIFKLRPGKDGLILKAEGRSGTFLPSVWEQLPDPSDFLQHLKNKAGLPSNYWSKQVEVLRYETDSFGD